MMGLSEIKEWSEIEIEAELSDGTGGPVTLKKRMFKNVLSKSLKKVD
ncbi:MAG: hypothetical protein R2764_15155 [Bacteroidales bacterium]